MDKCNEYLKFRLLCENNNDYLLSVVKIKSNETHIGNLSDDVKLEVTDVKYQNLLDRADPYLITSSSKDRLPINANEPEVKVKNSAIALFSCNHCHLSFHEIESESEHNKVYHPHDDEHYCYICTKDFSLKYTELQKLKSHLYSHK